MANGKYWRDDPYYYSAIYLDRDVPEYDPDEDEDLNEEDENNDWEDLEDDTHGGGSHEESEGNDDWRGFNEDED